MERKNKKTSSDYKQLKQKFIFYFICIIVISVFIPASFYRFVWFRRGGELVVNVFQLIYGVDYEGATGLYDAIFRRNADIIWLGCITAVAAFLFHLLLNWFTNYFEMVNQGIDALLSDDAEVLLPMEIGATERKLHMVKSELKQRTLEAELATQRKNELVMYLAHDIRTPLTSVIGYLNLLAETPDLPTEQRAKYTDITLDKAYRLEKMVNEFFEITRYNMQQISVSKEPIDLYYMLVQLSDELSTVLSANGNTVVLKADENLTVHGDPDKLARVFNNILKNAAAYSFPNTEIGIFAEEKDNSVVISFSNKGKTLPKEKLSAVFERFYRLDEARTSNTGGAGLGLAIAKEIVMLHGGTITAESENDTVVFTISLPSGN